MFQNTVLYDRTYCSLQRTCVRTRVPCSPSALLLIHPSPLSRSPFAILRCHGIHLLSGPCEVEGSQDPWPWEEAGLEHKHRPGCQPLGDSPREHELRPRSWQVVSVQLPGGVASAEVASSGSETTQGEDSWSTTVTTSSRSFLLVTCGQ